VLGQRGDHDPGVCPGGQEDQWCPGVHYKECNQQGKGGDPWGCPAWGRLSGDLINASKYLKGGVECMWPGSFQWCPVTEQGATGTNWNTGREYEYEGKLLYYKGARALELSAHKGGTVSFPGDIQNLPRCFPVQPSLAGWLKWGISRGLLQPLCDVSAH